MDRLRPELGRKDRKAEFLPARVAANIELNMRPQDPPSAKRPALLNNPAVANTKAKRKPAMNRLRRHRRNNVQF